MKIAVLSDIHGNLEAFQAVLEIIGHLKVDTVISLGDNIGYGPDSEAVAGLLRQGQILSVLGNHETAIKNKQTLAWFNPVAQKALTIARSQLSDASLAWIRQLPRHLVCGGLRFVHGVPPDSAFLYLFQLPENKLVRKLAQSDESICFVGHTHELEIISWDDTCLRKQKAPPGRYALASARRYIINAGSVGQPRDGTSGAKFVVYDTDIRQLTVQCAAYPFEKTQEKILAAGIPRIYADRLAIGADPSTSKGTDP